MPLAENLARLRVTDGKTIEDVASGAQVTPALVSAIEGGRRTVPPKALKAIAAYFGVSVEALTR